MTNDDAAPASTQDSSEGTASVNDTPIAEQLEAAPSAPVRSDIWYCDGSIIIEAERTQFRVHKGVLAEHSSVFQDIFLIPHSKGEDLELIEGCPIVAVTDTAIDMAHLLRALYNP